MGTGEKRRKLVRTLEIRKPTSQGSAAFSGSPEEVSFLTPRTLLASRAPFLAPSRWRGAVRSA